MITPPNWFNAVILAALLLALYMNWMWPWGVLFVYWAVASILSGEAHLIGAIARRHAPILFWLVTTLWVVLGAVMIVADAAPTVVAEIQASSWRPQ